jgi:hypothetical protein
MGQRKLSILQQAYKEFFLDVLHEYSVDSPAKLSLEQKGIFFTNIKSGWKIKKAALFEKKEPQKPKSKKDTYSRVKVTKPAVGISPKKNTRPVFENTEEINEIVKIKSEPNQDQTADLQIKFDPIDFFTQDDPYVYPVVKMPKEGAMLKLPRRGRSMGKGYKEDDFHKAILASLPNIEVATNLHMTIPFFNRPYEPDIVLIDRMQNIYIDIEIDEPYDGYYRFPTHEIEKDDTRDLFFIESGWIVIRFTEKQIHTQEKQCIAYIKDVFNAIYNYKLDETSNCVSEPQWDYQQAVRWQKANYREKYLDIVQFGKQRINSQIIIETEEIDEIEQVINRTKKFEKATGLDNIAFEDATHKYHHTLDQTGNAEYISVTTLIDRFFPFDIDRFIERKASKEGITEEDVLNKFLENRDEAAEKGTFMHEQIENFLKGKIYDDDSVEFELFKKFYNQIVVYMGFEFVEAEKRILSEEYNVAGTVDALFKKPNSNDYLIVDWKRSKKLVVDGHPKMYGYGMALSELNHLDNSSYFKYALQQNIYKYILERDYGMNISSMNLIVLHSNYEQYYRVPLKPLPKEVKIIFNSINHKI